ncbi:two-component sensor histidine kinase [Bacillus sp. MKU004]|nr:two-component sensor histidine kinase [Bacillus sp. MKU004]
MREFQSGIQKRIYFVTVSVVITLMVLGVVVNNPVNIRFFIHGVFVLIVAACLLLYPLFENTLMRYITVISLAGYFYSLFYLYPETWTGFILICLIPALSILFFDKRLFYFSLVLNALFIVVTSSYIWIIDKGQAYSYVYEDITGNVVNFIASQIILYFIFFLSNVRIEKQRMYYEQVQQAERLKTTGQMAAAVAHEIRNPLTVVKGFLQFYNEDSNLNVDFKRNLALMIDELHTAEHVITQFLALSKPDQDRIMDCLDMKDILNDVTELLTMYGLLNDNRLDLSLNEGCWVNVHSIEIKQLFVNLIKNAIEASPQSAVVSISVKKDQSDVTVQVTDRGKGMTPEQMKSLGTPFYSLKSKGTGLGLMICYNIVEKYNGTIRFESVPGKGTIVTVRFPLAVKG